MTNKLVVIISSLKVPKIKKILLYEMKFLVPNYSCLQNPWLGGYRPQIPILSVLNRICWTPPPNKIPGYTTAVRSVWKPWIREFLARVLQGATSRRVTKQSANIKTVSKLQLEPCSWKMEYCFVRVCWEHIYIIRSNRHVWTKNYVTDHVVVEHGRSNRGDLRPPPPPPWTQQKWAYVDTLERGLLAKT